MNVDARFEVPEGQLWAHYGPIHIESFLMKFIWSNDSNEDNLACPGNNNWVRSGAYCGRAG